MNSGGTLSPARTRRSGGGRKPTVHKDRMPAADLEGLVEPTASGDPDSPLRWTSKSVRRLAGELTAMGHTVSHRLVADLLNASGYSLQGNRTTREGPSHPDRKKKELVGDFRNAGREWRPKGDPEPVLVHDFLIPEQGKVHPV